MTAPAAPLLSCSELSVHFPVRRPGRFWSRRTDIVALDQVSFELREGEILGVVGESGCGKSTLARAITALIPVSGGRIEIMGRQLDGISASRLRDLRKHIQMVFQDPLGSLDPRMRIGATLEEPLRALRPELRREDRRAHAAALLAEVGLLPTHGQSYPHELSGGQCQRVGLARALIVEPRILVLDEALSALDVSVQAQMVTLLESIRANRGTAMIFISHDIATVQRLCDRVMVMYLGRIVETASASLIAARPVHPYTQALVAATPNPDPRSERARPVAPIRGETPSPLQRSPGCHFAPRCPHAIGVCRELPPPLESQAFERHVACHVAGMAQHPTP